MSKETVGRVHEAFSELEKATVPVVHELIGLLQKNVEHMSASGKEVLQIVDKNTDRIAGAAVRLASSSTELVVAVLGNRDRSAKPSPSSAKRS